MNRDGLTREPAFGRVALCVTCRTNTLVPVAVRYIESSSGPGTTLWACPAHAPNLTPGPMPGELEPGA